MRHIRDMLTSAAPIIDKLELLALNTHWSHSTLRYFVLCGAVLHNRDMLLSAAPLIDELGLLASVFEITDPVFAACARSRIPSIRFYFVLDKHSEKGGRRRYVDSMWLGTGVWDFFCGTCVVARKLTALWHSK